jgi:hypothetical protein
MKNKLALIALPLVLVLSACGSSSEPTPSPTPIPTPSPTETVSIVDPNATATLAGSSIEALWQAANAETAAAYKKTGALASRVVYADGTEGRTFYFTKDNNLFFVKRSDLECNEDTFQITPIVDTLGTPDPENPNLLIYAGQNQSKTSEPTAYLVSNNLLISAYTTSIGKNGFTVHVTRANRLVESYSGTFANYTPLEAVSILAKLNYTATFNLMSTQDSDIKFDKIYQHTYLINDLIEEITVKEGAAVAKSAKKYYDPTQELLYNFDRKDFYMYNFEKNTIKLLGKEPGPIGCDVLE